MYLSHTGVVEQTVIVCYWNNCQNHPFLMSYALDEVIEVANCGSNINLFSNISGEKRLNAQHQYEQGHKKPGLFFVVVKYAS